MSPCRDVSHDTIKNKQYVVDASFYLGITNFELDEMHQNMV